VKTTNPKAVVTITDLFVTLLSILKTRPKATAPLIVPAYEIKTRSLNLMPDLYLNNLK